MLSFGTLELLDLPFGVVYFVQVFSVFFIEIVLEFFDHIFVVCVFDSFLKFLAVFLGLLMVFYFHSAHFIFQVFILIFVKLYFFFNLVNFSLLQFQPIR